MRVRLLLLVLSALLALLGMLWAWVRGFWWSGPGGGGRERVPRAPDDVEVRGELVELDGGSELRRAA